MQSSIDAQNLPLTPEVAAVVACVPQWSQAHDLCVAPLHEVISLNNENYRVTVDQIDYVLRIAAPTAVQYLGIRRSEEREAVLAASRAGLAPEVIYFDSQGNMVTRLIAGQHWKPEQFSEPQNIVRAAKTLRHLHSVQGVEGDRSVYRRVEHFIASARLLELEVPPEVDAYQEKIHQFEQQRRADPDFILGLSHNDFWGNNFLDDGQNLWVLDWEFGGNGDGLYDLATLSLAGHYSQEQQSILLQAYHGSVNPDRLQSLQIMQYVVFFFEATWSLVQHGLRGSAGFDYLGYAQRRFQAMQRWLETY